MRTSAAARPRARHASGSSCTTSSRTATKDGGPSKVTEAHRPSAASSVRIGTGPLGASRTNRSRRSAGNRPHSTRAVATQIVLWPDMSGYTFACSAITCVDDASRGQRRAGLGRRRTRRRPRRAWAARGSRRSRTGSPAARGAAPLASGPAAPSRRAASRTSSRPAPGRSRRRRRRPSPARRRSAGPRIAGRRRARAAAAAQTRSRAGGRAGARPS